MKYTKATARTLYLTGSSYEIGYRLGDVISKDTVWRRKCVIVYWISGVRDYVMN